VSFDHSRYLQHVPSINNLNTKQAPHTHKAAGIQLPQKTNIKII